MNFETFCEEPWKSSHKVFVSSHLAMTPAPEYASGEIILSSLYREIGFPDVSEPKVPQLGRDLDREIQKHRNSPKEGSGRALDADSFHVMLHSTLEIPKQPNQSSKRFLEVTPLVPQVATFSGSARLAGNSWPAGSLIRRMVWLGASSADDAQKLWNELFQALSVDAQDDIFARFIQNEIALWTPDKVWSKVDIKEGPSLASSDRAGLSYPAKQFCTDLSLLIAAKKSMTRRQWASLLESVIRIGVVSHIVWLCEVHERAAACLHASLNGGGPKTIEETRVALFPRVFSFLTYGDRAGETIKDRAAAYLAGRIRINAILWALEAVNGSFEGGIGSSDQLLKLCDQVRASAETLNNLGVSKNSEEILERESRVILCTKGVGSNIKELWEQALRQRRVANEMLRGYDQGYFVRKKSASKNSPWVVGFGPVAILALVHCSLAGSASPRSVRRLAQHLAEYGISVDYQDIAENDLGQQLRILGLVLDSPDAESGMLLVPPFAEQHA